MKLYWRFKKNGTWTWRAVRPDEFPLEVEK